MTENMSSWWRHQMETFPCYCPFVRGIHRSQRPVIRSFHVFVFFIYAWINRWVNNREAGDLRRYRAHYDVIVMWYIFCLQRVMCCAKCKMIPRGNNTRSSITYLSICYKPFGVDPTIALSVVLDPLKFCHNLNLSWSELLELDICLVWQ